MSDLVINNDIKVYVINLDKSEDRLAKVSKALNDNNISFVRFPAINGNNIQVKDLQTGQTFSGKNLSNYLSVNKDNLYRSYMCNPKLTSILQGNSSSVVNLEAIKKNITEYSKSYEITCSDNGDPMKFFYKGDVLLTEEFSWISRNYLNRPLKAGEFGLWCSNHIIWKDAIKNNYSKIIIFEDDIKIPNLELKEKLKVFDQYLPQDFDVAYLGLKQQCEGGKLTIENNSYVKSFTRNSLAWGTHGVMYSKKGLEKLLGYEEYTAPIDTFIWHKSIYRNLDNPLDEHLISYISTQKLIGLDHYGPSLTMHL